MRNLCWALFALSLVAFLVGAVARFTPSSFIQGVGAGTYWKAAMAFLAYAVSLRILGEERRPV